MLVLPQEAPLGLSGQKHPLRFLGRQHRDAPLPWCLQSSSALSLVERFWGLLGASLVTSCGGKAFSLLCPVRVSLADPASWNSWVFPKGCEPWGLFCWDGSCCLGVVGNESGKRKVWHELDWEWSRLLGMVEDTGNGPGCGTAGGRRMVDPAQGRALLFKQHFSEATQVLPLGLQE